MGSIAKAMKDALEHRLFYRSISVGSVRKHPFLLALHHWGRFARRNDVPPRETSPAAKSEEKRMFSQANLSLPACRRLLFPLLHACNKGNRRRLHAGKYVGDGYFFVCSNQSWKESDLLSWLHTLSIVYLGRIAMPSCL